MTCTCPHCGQTLDILELIYAQAQVRQREHEAKYSHVDKEKGECNSTPKPNSK